MRSKHEHTRTHSDTGYIATLLKGIIYVTLSVSSAGCACAASTTHNHTKLARPQTTALSDHILLITSRRSSRTDQKNINLALYFHTTELVRSYQHSITDACV